MDSNLNLYYIFYTVANQKKSTAKMWVKLFGIIPIKQIEVELSEGEEVYLGGNALGFSITTKGLLVVGTNTIESSKGEMSPTAETQIQTAIIASSLTAH